MAILTLSLLAFFGLMLVGSYFAPKAYYKLFPAQAVVLPTQEEASVMGGEYQAGAKTTVVEVYRPKYDVSLPDGDWLIIDQIGAKKSYLIHLSHQFSHEKLTQDLLKRELRNVEPSYDGQILEYR
jgi:hypothetical protein